MAGRGIAARWDRLAGRFSTKASRFRCALISGFALTAIGTATLVSAGVGNADDLFGGLGSLFSGQSSFQQYTQQSYAPQYASRQPPRNRRNARRRNNEVKSPLKLASTRHRGPVRLGRLSMCVRTCDGFAFPVGAYHGEADRASHEATCQSECPGATTSLYILPNGADSIGEAIGVNSGRTYSQMPSAFRYTTYVQAACTCHPREGNRVASVLRDFTLRRGDAVMTSAGVRVFHGGMHFPYRQTDFVALSRSQDVHDRQRATFQAIERSSIAAAPASTGGRLPASSAGLVTGLEKQASLAP